MNQRKSLTDMLFIGKHYKIERFTIIVLTILVCMGIVSALSLAKDMKRNAHIVDIRAIYNHSFTMSKTGITGKVNGVYTDASKKRAFVLLSFDDTTNISTDANQYRAFVTGSDVQGNRKVLKGHPSGSIYMFGNTGYMGLYLVNEQGFTPQVLDITVRALKQLKADDPNAEQQAKTDPSFKDNDQFSVYVNPGASRATTISCLNGTHTPTSTELFNQTIAATFEEKAHTQLHADLEDMRTTLVKIGEYSNRLDQQDSVLVPPAPALVQGDSISVSKGVYTTTFKQMVPGGYDFDWQHEHVGSGWVQRLIAKSGHPTLSIEQYFAQQNKLHNDATSTTSPAAIVWKLKDGTKLSDLNTGDNVGRYAAISKDVQNLTDAWQHYISVKTTYQTTDLQRLLALDAQSSVIDSATTINAERKALMVY